MIGQQAKERAVLERGLSWGRESGGDHSYDKTYRGSPGLPPWGGAKGILHFALALAYSDSYIYALV